jgi:uncharacterized membrane protein
VSVVYDDEFKAAEVMAALRRLQSEYLIDLEDAIYVTKDAEGKMKMHQSVNLTGAGAAGGALWGGLIGLIFLAPLAGMAIGAASGALAGKFSDYGIDDKFVKELSSEMGPSSSAVFVLVRKSTPERVLPEVGKFGGKVLHTNLAPDGEARLQAALDAGGAQTA